MKFAVCGNYGAQNLGDEMILKGLILSLNQSFPAAEIKVIEHFPSGFRSFFKSLFKESETKKIVKECDYFILGGGGLFGSLSFKANVIWLIQAYQAYRLGKRVLMLGQSVGEIKWGIIRYFVRRAFNKAHLIVVRDSNSKKVLEKLGVEKEIFVAPDFAFMLPTPAIQDSQSEHKTAIIALRYLFNLPVNFINILTDFCKFLLTEKNYHLKFINFQEGHESDAPLHEKIIQNLNSPEKIEYLTQDKIDNLLTEFAQADFVIGMRLHSIICALKANKPLIALNYSSKVEGIIQDANLQKNLLDPYNLNLDLLKKLFTELENQKPEYQPDLSTKFSLSSILAK
ncbi:MAG: polysaccharide pyruvyl transferase family protein [Patescibacteria group bacterium]